MKEATKDTFAAQLLAKTVTAGTEASLLPLFQMEKGQEETAVTGSFRESFIGEFPFMVQAMSGAGKRGETGAEADNRVEAEDGAEAETGMEADNRAEEDNGAEADGGAVEEVTELQDILSAMLEENGSAGQAEVKEEGTTEITAADVLAENSAFQKNQKTNSYDLQALADYQTFVSTFYTIDAGTTAGSNELNLEKLLSKDVTISKETEGPQILIYHTHSLEGFIDSEPGERSQTIVGVGDRLTRILTEEYGYEVLHHTAEYDTVRDDAYANSLPDITRLLEENPSIQVVIDLHRDAGVAGVRRVVDLNGKPTATFMLFNGLSRTRKTGNIDYLYNPYLEDNLSFSFQMQMKAGEYYPGLTRKIYLKAYRYNMHLKPLTLLIELGDSNNTVEEAMNTCDPLAHILDMVLSGEG